MRAIFTLLSGPISARVRVLNLEGRAELTFFKDCPRWDLVSQHEILLTVILPTFPDLFRVKFTEWIEWELDEYGSWIPSVFAEDKFQQGWNGVLSGLLKDNMNVVDGTFEVIRDYKGALAAFLPANHTMRSLL